MKNKYVARSCISERKFREIMRYFSIDPKAVQIHKLNGHEPNLFNAAYRVKVRRIPNGNCLLRWPSPSS